jgi:hypothetical protein
LSGAVSFWIAQPAAALLNLPASSPVPSSYTANAQEAFGLVNLSVLPAAAQRGSPDSFFGFADLLRFFLNDSFDGSEIL